MLGVRKKKVPGDGLFAGDDISFMQSSVVHVGDTDSQMLEEDGKESSTFKLDQMLNDSAFSNSNH